MPLVHFVTLTLFVLLQACGNIGSSISVAALENTKVATAMHSGIDLEAIDASVRPQDDFHRYANGAWLDATEMPPEYGKYGTFTVLTERAERQLKGIIQASAASSEEARLDEPGSRKLGDMYASYMDTSAIETRDLEGIADELGAIDAIQDRSDLLRVMSQLHRRGFSSPFGAGILPDFKDSNVYAFYMFQDGIGLPDRDYFLDRDNQRFTKAVADYQLYAADLLSLAGVEDALVKGQNIVALEYQIAEAHWPRTENRQPEKLYNPYQRNELNKLADFPWDDMLELMGVDQLEYIVIGQPSYFETLATLLATNEISQWQDYLRLRVLSDAANYLPERFADRRFEFYGRQLSGLEKQKERWRRGISAVSSVLGEPLGKAYVKQNFPPEAKQRMQQMVNNLLAEFEIGIDQLAWMSKETKAQAKDKLSKISVKIGYPDEWRDFSSLKIQADDLIGNMRRATEFEYQYELAKLGQPINREEWGMHPHRVNAYYNPTMNEIVFPAGILQPPMFDLSADDAANYGAAGMVIGHEISHGFDDQGSTFDGDGNLRDWWGADDRAEFKRVTDRLVEQFNKFEPVEGMHINGELTLGENIGDLSGASVAVKAYQRSLAGKQAPVIDGFSGLQRFFLGYARTWRTKYRDEVLARQLVSDPHSPHRERVNGIVQNMPEFYEAFDVKPGDAHYLSSENRVKVW